MIGIAAKEREGKGGGSRSKNSFEEESRKHVPFCNFIDGDGEGDVMENGRARLTPFRKCISLHRQKVEDFFRCLALCHSVEVSTVKPVYTFGKLP